MRYVLNPIFLLSKLTSCPWHWLKAVQLRCRLEVHRPWISSHVQTPAAMDPLSGETRLRPLIYVYELPSMYNQLMLQVSRRK
jgi:hypothetical protein